MSVKMSIMKLTTTMALLGPELRRVMVSPQHQRAIVLQSLEPLTRNRERVNQNIQRSILTANLQVQQLNQVQPRSQKRRFVNQNR